jgi:MoaA/NifB/PqqE/SkfB family radical SAM enzyme
MSGTSPDDSWNAIMAALSGREETVPLSGFPGQALVLLDRVPGPFHRAAHGWSTAIPDSCRFNVPPWGGIGSPLVLLEDGGLLTPWSSRAALRQETGATIGGDGILTFAPSDGSDPNVNGRAYRLAVVTLEGWTVPVLKWPAWSSFRNLETGQELPVYLSLGLTNKCNLRCDICGSQSDLDRNKTERRFTRIETIRAIARTTFPFIREVELNSFGEPTLHPAFAEIIDLINHHRCLLKLQTNATLLTPGVIDSLKGSCGYIWLSVDATGEVFERVRRFGRWSDVDRGVRTLMAEHDPNRLRVGLYPTITRRTLPAMLDVLEWADELGIPFVHYHVYEPIVDGVETAPSPGDLARQIKRVREWLRQHPDGPDVQIGLDWLKHTSRSDYPDQFHKMKPQSIPSHPVPPADPVAHPTNACHAPWQQINVGLDGEIFACCRAQKSPLGWTDSVEAFCASWFGEIYDSLRSSLLRANLRADVLRECAGCVRVHLGSEAASRPVGTRAGSIVLPSPMPSAGGNCFIIDIPGLSPPIGDDVSGTRHPGWALFEDDTPLGPAHAVHDHIRQSGWGAYSHWGTQVYFSTSDNSDPNTNGRRYTLRPPPDAIANSGPAGWLRRFLTAWRRPGDKA